MFKLGETVDKNKVIGLSPVVLAFVGDAVYSLFVRERLAVSSDKKTGELNELAVREVKASAQAEFIGEILPILTEEEAGVFRRARNTKKKSRSKSATVAEYNLSTGFEAVLGFLYLTGQFDRLNYILNKGATDEG